MAYSFADHMILATTQGASMSHEPHERGAPLQQLMSIDQIVKRACDLSEALYVEMKRREFVVKIPHEGWEAVE